jgi:pimeloyl-ACP methyl ester carboxylesterase/DNA-binding CsgD family transcriptional regulator
VRQRIRFCVASDGARLAYAVHGRGAPLVRAATWLTHLEYDWDSPVWRHWLEQLGERFTVVRYDERGCGLSDRDLGELSLERWVEDLETVVDAAGVERFALLGVSQGGAVAVAYAVKNPERVSHLVLYGAYARGRKRRGDEAQARQADLLRKIIQDGWGEPSPVFRRVFTSLFLPRGSPEQMEWFDELQRNTTTAEIAARLRGARQEVDITALLPRVKAPTLVLHARDDGMVPFEEGRRLASGIPNAHFVPLEGCNHILLEDEPAWPAFLAAVDDFLGSAGGPVEGDLDQLSARERDVLELVAVGLSNEQIAERLFLSVRTVERHLSNIYAKLNLSGKAARAAAAALFSRT